MEMDQEQPNATDIQRVAEREGERERKRESKGERAKSREKNNHTGQAGTNATSACALG